MQTEIIDNDRFSQLVITETVAKDDDHVLGSDDHCLDIHRFAGSNSKWCLMAIPMLLSRICRAGYEISVQVTSPSIIVSADRGYEIDIGAISMVQGVEIEACDDLSLVRWHGDIVSIKGKHRQYTFNLASIEKITAKKVVASSILNKEVTPAQVEITLSDREPKLDHWKRPIPYYDIKVMASDHRFISDIIPDYNSKQFRSYGPKPLINKAISYQKLPLPGVWVVSNALSLFYLLHSSDSQFKYISDSDMKKALKDLQDGEVICSLHGNSVSFIPKEDLSVCLKITSKD